MANFNNNRTWGIEIEFLNVGIDRNKIASDLNALGIDCRINGHSWIDRPYWELTTDSSVGADGQVGFGNELVSPPLKGEEGFRQLKIVTDVLKANHVKVNKTCGLHVHQDAHDFKADTFKKLFALYINYEGVIDSMMPNSRRLSENNYCDTIRKDRRWDSQADIKSANQIQYMLDKIKTCKTAQEISNLYQGDRYHKLNIEAFVAHGTIEFRQHSGTIEFDKISNWIILTNMMVEKSFEQVAAFKFNPIKDNYYEFSRRFGLYEQAGGDTLAVKVRKFYFERIKNLTATAGTEVAA